ncbi:ABC transporter substrate-binding protein [Metamycoplasma hyosynoviae]|uniref:ABC transporter substrate-binding protein n=1 Tax=Metamycoplasma hyosynoviae TaxID=29559 RepID=UPI002361616E|nr:ABC transporter substrate-binding protein [Metamycoplasma hyosynoviae]MDD1365882.1 ABC transporter substrate-binding protein [Metamycoplasma hyosynoviae]
MKTKTKLILSLTSLAAVSAAPLLFVSCSCRNIGYDLGLTVAPLNSLNYIKYLSVDKVLPSLVESPLKSGPNESLKRIYALPEIKMSMYGGDDNSNTMENFVKVHADGIIQPSSQFYPLDQFGSTTGTLIGPNGVLPQISAIRTNNNKFLSVTMNLNHGLSKWSNNDDVYAEDYIDALHYILDFNTGSQKQTNLLQKKIKATSRILEAQQNYVRKFQKAYQNPFGYPDLAKGRDGKLIYKIDDKIDPTKPFASLWPSQNKGDEDYVEAIRKAALDMGLYSGRLYFNHSNAEILSSIPYSPEFDFSKEVSYLMLPNPNYDPINKTADELKNIPKRVKTLVRKYPYADPYQKWDLSSLLQKASELKAKYLNQYPSGEYDDMKLSKINESEVNPHDTTKDLDITSYAKRMIFCYNEYSLRIEYDSFEPTSLSNAYHDLEDTLIPINRKFVESIGGINNFGLDRDKFLTNGPFTIDGLVFGPQGYMTLKKDNRYYSHDRTISNKIKLYFSSDSNLNSALYDDGYIASTRIPAIQQINYWSNLNYRKNMNKSSGFGTIAFAFNLDQETNGKSYLNDNNLRNAIYYAINRNDLLKIVGWNSSFPVNTWTAFGQSSSSFGDATELGFDHDTMLTKVDKTLELPIQNYSHIDHLSKSYKFEHVDRTDKTYLPKIANKYLDLFKKDHPNIKQISLKYIHNSTDEQLNAGIGLKDALTKAFGKYIDLEIKGLPENVYEDARTKGQFDIIYRNFDTFGSDSYSYVRVFFKPDEIKKADQKSTGFRNNPAASWTYKDYFKELGITRNPDTDAIEIKDTKLADDTRERLRLDEEIWNKIIDLSLIKKGESISKYTERYSAYFSGQFNDEEKAKNFTERTIVATIAALEKIIRDGSPVIPLMEVDTYWEISRVGGVKSLYKYSLQYAYDVNNPPIKTLPTKMEF